MSLKNLGCFKAKLLGNMGDKTGARVYHWTGDISSSLLFSARLMCYFRQGVQVFSPKAKRTQYIAQGLLEEACKKISPS